MNTNVYLHDAILLKIRKRKKNICAFVKYCMEEQKIVKNNFEFTFYRYLTNIQNMLTCKNSFKFSLMSTVRLHLQYLNF